ncbi:hypothetical protein ABW19_dt0205216 [Dactylella cylindrospora]|nr:hypothetical protein ABW19_dt0205216 [Dactylella cylindrospora]
MGNGNFPIFAISKLRLKGDKSKLRNTGKTSKGMIIEDVSAVPIPPKRFKPHTNGYRAASRYASLAWLLPRISSAFSLQLLGRRKMPAHTNTRTLCVAGVVK